MNIKEFVYYYKAVIVSIFASLTDMFIMFELSKGKLEGRVSIRFIIICGYNNTIFWSEILDV